MKLRLLSPLAVVGRTLLRGPRTAKELAAETGLPLRSVQRALEKLFRSGMTERDFLRFDPMQERRLHYSLTQEGRSLFAP